MEFNKPAAERSVEIGLEGLAMAYAYSPSSVQRKKVDDLANELIGILATSEDLKIVYLRLYGTSKLSYLQGPR